MMAIKLGLQRDLLHEDSAEGVVFEKIARWYRCLRPIGRVCPDKVLLVIGVAVAIGVLIAPLVEIAEFGVLPRIRQTVLIVILLGRKGNDKAYRRSILHRALGGRLLLHYLVFRYVRVGEAVDADLLEPRIAQELACLGQTQTHHIRDGQPAYFGRDDDQLRKTFLAAVIDHELHDENAGNIRGKRGNCG